MSFKKTFETQNGDTVTFQIQEYSRTNSSGQIEILVSRNYNIIAKFQFTDSVVGDPIKLHDNDKIKLSESAVKAFDHFKKLAQL